jgi:CheY-like chemotaxis protein
MSTHFLILDDDRGSCLLLRKIITSLGYTCDFVHSVADGLRAAANTDYALVLIDSFLPDTSGFVALNAMKLLPREGPAPAFIGIMSNHDEQMQRRLVTAGMSGTLVKPFCRTTVAERIGQALSNKQGQITRCAQISLICGDASKKVCMNGRRNSGATLPLEQLESSCSNFATPLDLSEISFREAEDFTFRELNT